MTPLPLNMQRSPLIFPPDELFRTDTRPRPYIPWKRYAEIIIFIVEKGGPILRYSSLIVQFPLSRGLEKINHEKVARQVPYRGFSDSLQFIFTGLNRNEVSLSNSHLRLDFIPARSRDLFPFSHVQPRSIWRFVLLGNTRPCFLTTCNRAILGTATKGIEGRRIAYVDEVLLGTPIFRSLKIASREIVRFPKQPMLDYVIIMNIRCDNLVV